MQPTWKELAVAPKAQQLPYRPSSLRWMRKLGECGTRDTLHRFSELINLVKTLSFELTSVNSVHRGLIAFLLYEQLEKQ